MLSKRKLVEEVSRYLVEALNVRAMAAGIQPIVEVVNGQTESLEMARRYPALFVVCSGRTIDGYFTDYDFSVGIALTAPTPEMAEAYGDQWEDILEDIYRNDCSLGGLVVDIKGSTSISGQQASGMWFVASEMTVEMCNES